MPKGSAYVICKNKMALKPLHVSQNLQSTDGETSSIITLIRLDSIIKSAVKSFNFEQNSKEDREIVHHMSEQSPKTSRRG